jgi:ribonuclease Z
LPARELTILGTASQVPTRHRNHNGYALRWDAETILFDPGEGTQRQMLLAGITAHALTRICVTHFHGDHSLGLAGVLQRASLDRVPHPIAVHYPASGEAYFERLRHATAYHETAHVVPAPVPDGGGSFAVTSGGPGGFTLTALPLSHTLDAVGYRLAEPEGRRMLPERLAAHGIRGPDIATLQRHGSLRGVTLEQVSAPKPGQSFAFIMDTRLCDAAFALAEGCDLAVIEATFLAADAALATAYGHLTAGQAARVAAESGVRHLVLTHFSQRYTDPAAFAEEAREAGFTGELTIAEDLTRVPLPGRRTGRPPGQERP